MKKNIIYNIAFVLVLVISAFMYGTLMFNNNVWYDEAYSLAMIKHSFSEIAQITAEDVHPPLYYFGLKLFTSLGGDVIILSKIFSIIPVLLTMLLGYLEGNADPNDQEGKTRIYTRERELVELFLKEQKSIVCREILGLEKGQEEPPAPSIRTVEYYESRPCLGCVETAARIIEQEILRK